MAFRRESDPSVTPDADDAAYGRQRRRIFLMASAPALALGLLYTAWQPAVFESAATVLMSAPTAIDEQMLEADIQGVAIQRRTLTGRDITASLADRMNSSFDTRLAPLEMRAMLDVRSVPDTNLLELFARGPERDLLPPLVETWIDVYTEVRAADISERKDRTLYEVQEELTGLSIRLDKARTALEDYRAEHEIISMERQENEVLARLDGLNTALNTAIEEEVAARAYLDTLRSSLAAGEQFVPDSERSSVTTMAAGLAALRTQLSELRSKYTDDYIRKDPRLREIPERIAQYEKALAEAYVTGTRTEMDNAERAWRATAERVRDLQQRLDAHKQSVSDFNTIYATHEALVEDLGRLEELNRETQARLVQIEVRQVDKYPQIAVIDWPTPKAPRVGPPYLLLLGTTLGISLGLGIFAVWLYSYLHPRRETPAYVTLQGVHMYPQDAAQALGRAPAANALAAQSVERLAHDGDEPQQDEPETRDGDNPLDPRPDPA